jgi:hypothetical protein
VIKSTAGDATAGDPQEVRATLWRFEQHRRSADDFDIREKRADQGHIGLADGGDRDGDEPPIDLSRNARTFERATNGSGSRWIGGDRGGSCSDAGRLDHGELIAHDDRQLNDPEEEQAEDRGRQRQLNGRLSRVAPKSVGSPDVRPGW